MLGTIVVDVVNAEELIQILAAARTGRVFSSIGPQDILPEISRGDSRDARKPLCRAFPGGLASLDLGTRLTVDPEAIHPAFAAREAREWKFLFAFPAGLLAIAIGRMLRVGFAQ